MKRNVNLECKSFTCDSNNGSGKCNHECPDITLSDPDRGLKGVGNFNCKSRRQSNMKPKYKINDIVLFFAWDEDDFFLHLSWYRVYDLKYDGVRNECRYTLLGKDGESIVGVKENQLYANCVEAAGDMDRLIAEFKEDAPELDDE